MESVREFKLPAIERTCLVEDFPLEKLGRHVRLEVADERDRSIIERFLNSDFIDSEPMNRAIDLKVDEFEIFLKPTLDTSLSQRATILAIDDGCLCGLFINNIHEVKGVRKEYILKEDYAEEFDANDTPSENFKKVAVMLDVVGQFVAQNLPADVREYFYLDVLSVHKDYTRNGLAKKLTIESCKYAFEQGYRWAQITGSAVATNRIARSLGFTQIVSLELKNFKAHGRQIFPDQFSDGGTQIGSYVVEIEHLLKEHRNSPE